MLIILKGQGHRIECETQPNGFPCICDHLAEQEYQNSIDSQIEEYER